MEGEAVRSICAVSDVGGGRVRRGLLTRLT